MSKVNSVGRGGIRRLVLAMSLALLPAVAQVGHAADKESGGPSKSIKLRNFDEQAGLSEQYRAAARAKRMESITRLKALLQKGATGDTKAEMMLRLADFYFQEGQDLFLKEMADYDKVYSQCFDNPNCDESKLNANNQASQAWQKRSIKLYQTILRNHPRYPRADQATFFMGSSFKNMGQERDAVDAFKTLVKTYPDSDFAIDSYVMIGEYYWDVENNAFGALKAYSKAAQDRTHPKYAYANYKLGWCYYNVGEYQKAIETMKSVVTFSMAGDSSNSNLQLQDEALKDLVRFFADADQMDEAIAYFNSLGKQDLVRATLKRLAAMFADQGKWDRAVEMYRRLILDDPMNTDNPEYQVEIVAAYEKQAKRKEVLVEINKLRADYGPGSPWATSNASDPKAIAAAQETIEGQLRRIASKYFNTAREYKKSRHPATTEVYELARTAYKTYLEIFPTHKHAYAMHYEYAELLYELKDFAGAYTEYMTVVDLDPKGEHSKFCAESAIFSAEEQVKKEGGGDASGKITAKVTADAQAKPLSEWEARLVAACAKYAQLFPSDRKVQGILYKSGYLLYNKYRFDEAATQFQAVIKMNPQSKDAEFAADLILDSLAIRKNWTSLRDNAKFYYEQKGLGSKAFKGRAYTIYQNASFKVIEEGLGKDQDFGKAGTALMAWYAEFPTAENNSLALNNAAAYFSKANMVADSMTARHILVDDPKFGKKTKYYYDQIGYLGYDYESIADYDKAAFYYEKLWSLFPEEDKKNKARKTEEQKTDLATKAADALYTAAVFRNGLGQWKEAIDNYNQFVAAFPEDTRVPDIKLRVAKIYEANEQWKDSAAAFEAFYKSPPKGATVDSVYFARLHHGQSVFSAGDKKKRDAIYAAAVRDFKSQQKKGTELGAAAEFVAEMLFEQARPILDQYLAQRITYGRATSDRAQDKALVKSMQDKSKEMQKMEKVYQEIIDTGAGEWGLASVVALGLVYENMGTSLVGADVPGYLTEDQREIYMMSLEDRAYAMEEKAVAAFKLGIDRSFELTLYNDNTAIAARKLGAIRPDDFPGLNEQLLEPRWTSSKSGKQYPFETSL